MQNALRIDLYFYSTPFCLLLCKLHTWQSRWSSFSIWFSHSVHDLQLYIKNNHWRGDFDYSKMKNCLILEDDLTVLYIWLIFYYCTWPPVLMSLGVLDLLRLLDLKVSVRWAAIWILILSIIHWGTGNPFRVSTCTLGLSLWQNPPIITIVKLHLTLWVKMTGTGN